MGVVAAAYSAGSEGTHHRKVKRLRMSWLEG